MKKLTRFFVYTLNIPLKLIFLVGLIYADYYLGALAINAINQRDNFSNIVGIVVLLELAYVNMSFVYNIIKLFHNDLIEESDQKS